MVDSDFNYRAATCSAVRTFRLLRAPPVVAEFFSVRYSVEIYAKPHTGGGEYLVCRLPWQPIECARELTHGGRGVMENGLRTGLDVETGTLAEVIFLRLVRQGDAEELAGPHLKIPPRGRR